MNYVITTGWWCSAGDQEDRAELIGDDSIRGREFHDLWYNAIRQTGSKANIYIIDSNSPIKPHLNDGEYLIPLEKNFGHSTRCEYRWAGVTRAHILGMTLAIVNGYDHWVYIEQDALLSGDGFIEKCIDAMKSPMSFGSGKGTPYPAQQSFMIIRASHIPRFINRLAKISSSDKEISPELKFCIASSALLGLIPEFIYRFIDKRGLINKAVRILIYKIIRILRGFNDLPFGHGRSRPLNFSDSHFYFQHGTRCEIEHFIKKRHGIAANGQNNHSHIWAITDQ